jgi:replicative DNA helicase
MSSFRESSGIEYSADVLMGLQYKGMDYGDTAHYTQEGKHYANGRESEADHYTRVIKLFEEMQSAAAKGESQPIELKLLKNRNGSRGTIQFEFIPKYNYFSEPKSYASNGVASAPSSSVIKKKKL